MSRKTFMKTWHSFTGAVPQKKNLYISVVNCHTILWSIVTTAITETFTPQDSRNASSYMHMKECFQKFPIGDVCKGFGKLLGNYEQTFMTGNTAQLSVGSKVQANAYQSVFIWGLHNIFWWLRMCWAPGGNSLGTQITSLSVWASWNLLNLDPKDYDAKSAAQTQV